MTRPTFWVLIIGGAVLNVAGSALIDGFYHESGYGLSFGYSEWGYTGWSV
ncbi:MAG: hypothetical protein JNM74_26150, partial [Myxococcales bacterium]|nr:hypothetical protein [Myxococcales bacterium]